MSIERDTTALRELAADVAALEVDSEELLGAMGRLLERGTTARFAAERDPTGKTWRAWSPSYARRRGAGEILTRTGRLAGSIESLVADVDEVVVGSPLHYARAVQADRPFLGVDDQEDELLRIATDALEEAIRRAA